MREEKAENVQNDNLDTKINAFFESIGAKHAIIAVILEDGKPIFVQKGSTIETAKLAKSAWLQLRTLFLESVGLGDD